KSVVPDTFFSVPSSITRARRRKRYQPRDAALGLHIARCEAVASWHIAMRDAAARFAQVQARGVLLPARWHGQCADMFKQPSKFKSHFN
ncbi:hypothetical protein HAX54_017370, partial [Datura stramonium]|nr:hypothetical protein [Datura stramonium]